MESSNLDGCSCSKVQNNSMECQNYTKIHNMIRWNSGKRVDPRLLVLLESFREIYINQRKFFSKIFAGDYEELFKKIGDALKRKKHMKKVQSMSRSMSMRAIGERGFDDDNINGLRNERFKIKTPKVIVAEPDGSSQGSVTQPTQGSSKDAK